MLLHNLFVSGEEQKKTICIRDGRISSIENFFGGNGNEESVLFDGAIAFPGLINSHDHLDFNLFPQFGETTYKNYTQWADAIHSRYKKEIDSVLKIPADIRTQWGVYKNLLNGFTTVVNHGEQLTIPDPLIHVFQECHTLHSAAFEKNWKRKINHPLKRQLPVVTHVGEGTDLLSSQEIDAFPKWNFLNREIVGVHGIAMNEKQAAKFNALVWCPASNYFLFGQTAPVGKLKNHTNILFGTDSTLSAGWNSWDHFRMARKEPGVSDQQIFDMLTINPAKTWKLNSRGKLTANGEADIVIAKARPGEDFMNSFFSTNPETILLVMQQGSIRLFDASLNPMIKPFLSPEKKFNEVRIGQSTKFVEGDPGFIFRKANEYCPGIAFPVEMAT